MNFKAGDRVWLNEHCTGHIIAITCDGDMAMVSIDLGDDIVEVNLDDLELVKED